MTETFDALPKTGFPEVVKIEPCTNNQCANGHRWPAQMLVQPCPGCGASVLLVRMINCPVCNEPTEKFFLRTDHTGQGFGIAALCRGQKGPAESNLIEMTRHAHKEVMEVWNEETGRMPAD